MKKQEEKKSSELFNVQNMPTKNLKDLIDSKSLNRMFSKKQLTLGQRAADFLTIWAGSWTFIFSFAIILIAWMILNTTTIVFGKWDGYPFILLNLVLSCLAAIQAPIILMSQNRTTERDRIRVEYDYAVNRKAEKEIREIRKDINSVLRHLKVKTKKSKNSIKEKSEKEFEEKTKKKK